MKKLFTDGLLLLIFRGVRKFWGRELETHLTKLLQYTDIQLNLQHGQIGDLQIAPRGFYENERPRCKPLASKVKETDDFTICNQRKANTKMNRGPIQGFEAANSGQF